MKRNKGITLIALIVTIIILIILSAITISNVMKSDLFTLATKGAESYQIASEREYIEQNILLVQAGKYIGNASAEKLGDTLNTKNLENSSNWHIIKVGDKTYKTGWNYIEKGTELQNYGKARWSWLVNYETGEVIQLEEDKYISLSAGDMLAVKDNLIINVDSSIIDEKVENKKEVLEEQLGDGVTLENFDYNESSGLTSTSFNFDGIDDYIKVQYDKQEQKDALAKNGFTFEFYGIWNGGTTDPRWKDGTYKGLFCYWNGDESKQAKLRFGIDNNGKSINWNVANNHDNYLSDYANGSKYLWNISYDVSSKWKQGEVIYVTITLDTSEKYNITDGTFVGVHSSKQNEKKNGEFYKQAVYINGEPLYEGDYNAELWRYFCEEELPTLNCFCLGRCSMDHDSYWHYSKMNAYALRLYSRALSEEEVIKNYEKSTAYHTLLTDK